MSDPVQWTKRHGCWVAQAHGCDLRVSFHADDDPLGKRWPDKWEWYVNLGVMPLGNGAASVVHSSDDEARKRAQHAAIEAAAQIAERSGLAAERRKVQALEQAARVLLDRTGRFNEALGAAVREPGTKAAQRVAIAGAAMDAAALALQALLPPMPDGGPGDPQR